MFARTFFTSDYFGYVFIYVTFFIMKKTLSLLSILCLFVSTQGLSIVEAKTYKTWDRIEVSGYLSPNPHIWGNSGGGGGDSASQIIPWMDKKEYEKYSQHIVPLGLDAQYIGILQPTNRASDDDRLDGYHYNVSSRKYMADSKITLENGAYLLVASDELVKNLTERDHLRLCEYDSSWCDYYDPTSNPNNLFPYIIASFGKYSSNPNYMELLKTTISGTFVHVKGKANVTYYVDSWVASQKEMHSSEIVDYNVIIVDDIDLSALKNTSIKNQTSVEVSSQKPSTINYNGITFTPVTLTTKINTDFMLKIIEIDSVKNLDDANTKLTKIKNDFITARKQLDGIVDKRSSLRLDITQTFIEDAIKVTNASQDLSGIFDDSTGINMN